VLTVHKAALEKFHSLTYAKKGAQKSYAYLRGKNSISVVDFASPICFLARLCVEQGNCSRQQKQLLNVPARGANPCLFRLPRMAFD